MRPTYKVRVTMSRPQATTAFIPISNRGSAPRPPAASAFMHADEAAQTHSWYNITTKKRGGKVTAEISIFGEIGWEVRAQEFIKELNALDADKIVVSINSVGGDVFDGVAIYNALRLNDASVTINVIGLAASAASFIAQAGDEVYMHRGSEMMIHDAAALAWGNAQVMRETGAILDKISNSIADIYAQRAGGTMEEWRAIMQAEMWYSPEEAVAAGLADKALDDEDEDAVAAKNGWDLQVFNYAGRKDAPSPGEAMRKIINQVKETSMGDTANENQGGTTTPPPTPEPPAAPEAPSTEPVETPDPAADEETPPAPTPEVPASNTGTPAVQNRAGVFMVQGQQVSDPQAVQSHITMLESFYNETRNQNRKDFINSLAAGPAPKILATQITAMEQLVATMSDEQYEMWKASYEAAPDVALLQAHGGEGSGTPSGTAASAAADRVETLKEIVMHHKRAGMDPAKIENTDSFKELKQLAPEYTLPK